MVEQTDESTIQSRRVAAEALLGSARTLMERGAFAEAAPRVRELRVEAYRLASEVFAEPWALGVIASAEELTGALARADAESLRAVAAFAPVTWMRSLLHSKNDLASAAALARARCELAEALLAIGETERAQSELEQAVVLLEPLCAADPNHPVWRANLLRAQERLAAAG